jgi:hypothetical protein
MNGRLWNESPQTGGEQEHIVCGAKKAVDEDGVRGGYHASSMVTEGMNRNANKFFIYITNAAFHGFRKRLPFYYGEVPQTLTKNTVQMGGSCG